MSQPSTLLKSEAIVLTVRPFSKTSQMVTWLTPEYGRVTTPIKGACRNKSAFLGQFDLFYTCELVWYAYDRDGVHQIRECAPLNLREALRTQWRSNVAAGYLVDFAMRTAMPRLPAYELYDNLTLALNALQIPEVNPTIVMVWFEVHALKALGHLPNFHTCTFCKDQERFTFAVEEGRFCCEHRPQRHPDLPTCILHKRICVLFNTLLHQSLEETLTQAVSHTTHDSVGRPDPFPGIIGLRRFLGLFLNYHLDLLPAVRTTTLDILLSLS